MPTRPDAARHDAAQAQALAARLPPLLAAALTLAASLTAGNHGRRRSRPGDAFWQYRRALPGDSAAAIDWRRSARGADLYVRESEWSASQGVWLWADTSGSMAWHSHPSLPDKAERARLIALALAAALLNGGERVAVLGDDRPPSSGPGTLIRLAETLLLRQDDRLPTPPRAPRRGEVVLISDFLHPMTDIAACVTALGAEGAGGHLMQVLDPAEESLPYQGRIRFAGLEGEADFVSRRTEDLHAAYAVRRQEHRQDLTALARRQGWSLALHHTDRPPHHALLALHARLSLAAGRTTP